MNYYTTVCIITKANRSIMTSSAFLSYAKVDTSTAEQLQRWLNKREVNVWRDQDSILAGERWPRKIGEGIVRNNVFLMLWSLSASTSNYVDFEWNTAIALQKTIIPILLDNTPLPPALAAFQAVTFPLSPNSRLYILHQSSQPSSTGTQQESVIEKLKAMPNEPDEAAETAKNIYQQEGWAVQGPVYQIVGNNNTVTNAPSSNSLPSKKWYERWQAYVAILIGLLSVPGTLLDIPKKVRDGFENDTNKTLSVKGSIITMDNSPVAGAQVKLNLLPDATTTTSNGGFIFDNVPGEVGEKVRVYVKANGYKPIDKYYTLPGPIQIKLEPLVKNKDSSVST